MSDQRYTPEFKIEAVRQVTGQVYKVGDVARLRRYTQKYAQVD